MKEKRVLLTGATGGVGQAVAHLLAHEGADVALVGTNEQKLHSLLTEFKLASAGRGRAHLIVADFRNLASLTTLVDNACQLLGAPVNVLVNNAGLAFHCPAERISVEELVEVFHVNALAPILLASKAFDIMKRSGGGQIINVTSVLGERAMVNTGGYTAAKHALSGFSKVLRQEGAAFGVSVTRIEFGAIETNFLDHTHDMATAQLFKKRNLRRIDVKVAAKWILKAVNANPDVCAEVITVLPMTQLV